MTGDLDQILISYQQPKFTERLERLRAETIGAAVFSADDPRREQLRQILRQISQRKDQAVAEYTEKFDKVRLTPEQFAITRKELQKAHQETDKSLLAALRQAIKNVRKYQAEIFIGDKNTHPGMKYTPVKRVGVCVPGVSAPLPSTVIMTAVPAQVAGVKEIAVVSPPRFNGSIHPVILATCHELDISEVYRIGGAQAVAALAYGTQTIRKVDKIVGPGSQWVQTAKLELFGHVGIDSIAGPSEVLIIANDKANPAWVAADMLSQAEHAPGSAVIFTDSQKFAEKVLDELKRQSISPRTCAGGKPCPQVAGLNRVKETIKCLKKFGGIVVFGRMDDAIKHANHFAPEHLEIQCGEQSRKIADQIEDAGAIFIGDYSPVAVGDYWAGPSHTLPTGGSARFFSALSANDFIKSISIIEYDKKQLAESADDIIRLAEAEGLDAHAKSIKIRQESAR
jgi:histidinol dehydrogenase